MAGGSGRGYESYSFIESKRTRCLVHYGSVVTLVVSFDDGEFE